jgi:hypothetical protein
MYEIGFHVPFASFVEDLLFCTNSNCHLQGECHEWVKTIVYKGWETLTMKMDTD